MRNQNLPKYIIGVILVLFIGFYSCKSKQRIVQADTELEDKAYSELFEDILYRDIKYSTFLSKLNLNISTGRKTLGSKGSLKIIRDEAIEVSIQPFFGVEMFRLYIEPDCIIILDRMNKRYVKESFDNIKGDSPIGFNFSTLQSLFTNSLFVTEQTYVEKKDYNKFKYTQSTDNYLLRANDKKSEIDYSFVVNGNDQITLTELYMPSKNYSLTWQYLQFELLKNFFFPHEMQIVASAEKIRLDTSISLSAITLNESLTVNNSIPSSYTKVELKEVLKLLADK